MSQCPHCGGNNGVHTKEIVEFRTFFDWQGEHNESEVGRMLRGGNAYYCCDCGRNVTKYIGAAVAAKGK